jgi:phage portal protein BeeE
MPPVTVRRTALPLLTQAVDTERHSRAHADPAAARGEGLTSATRFEHPWPQGVDELDAEALLSRRDTVAPLANASAGDLHDLNLELREVWSPLIEMHRERKGRFYTHPVKVFAQGSTTALSNSRWIPYSVMWLLYRRVGDLFAAVNSITRRVATWDWVVEPTVDPASKNLRRLQKECDRIAAFLSKPNQDDDTFQTLLTRFCVDLLTFDRGAIEKVFNGKGELVELLARRGCTVRVVRDDKGYITGYEQNLNWEGTEANSAFSLPGTATFARNQLIYMNIFPNTAGDDGTPPIEALLDEVVSLIRSSEQTRMEMDGNEIPQGVLVMTGGGPADKRQADTNFTQRGAINRLRVITVKNPQADVKWIELKRTLRDTQMRDIMGDVRRAVFRVYGVQPVEMGMTEAMPLATAKVQLEVGSSHLVQPLLEAIEQVINLEVISELVRPEDRGLIRFRFDRETKFTPEQNRYRMETLKNGVETGILTRNEARAELRLRPIEGGDVVTVGAGTNTIPLAKALLMEEPKPDGGKGPGSDDPKGGAGDSEGDSAVDEDVGNAAADVEDDKGGATENEDAASGDDRSKARPYIVVKLDEPVPSGASAGIEAGRNVPSDDPPMAREHHEVSVCVGEHQTQQRASADVGDGAATAQASDDDEDPGPDPEPPSTRAEHDAPPVEPMAIHAAAADVSSARVVAVALANAAPPLVSIHRHTTDCNCIEVRPTLTLLRAASGELPSDWPNAEDFDDKRTLDLRALGRMVREYQHEAAQVWEDLRRELLRITAAATREDGTVDPAKLGVAFTDLAIAQSMAETNWQINGRPHYTAAAELGLKAAKAFTEADDFGDGWREQADAYADRAFGYLTAETGPIRTVVSLTRNELLRRVVANRAALGEPPMTREAVDALGLGEWASVLTQRAEPSDTMDGDDPESEDEFLVYLLGRIDAQAHRIDNWTGKLVELAFLILLWLLSNREWMCEWIAQSDGAGCEICVYEGQQGVRKVEDVQIRPAGDTPCGGRCRCVLIFYPSNEVIDRYSAQE